MADTTQTSDLRNHRRRSVLWIGTLVFGKHHFPCQVWNMSLGGARLKIDVPLRDETDVVLSIPTRGEVPARVVWCEDKTMGIRFTVGTDVVQRTFGDRVQLADPEDWQQ